MDNILKKFYSGGTEDYNPDPNKKVYQNFFYTDPDKIIKKSRGQNQNSKQLIQNDENFLKVPIVDNIFTNSTPTKDYPSYDKLIHTQPSKQNQEKLAYRAGESMKIQIMEEKIRQMGKKYKDDQEAQNKIDREFNNQKTPRKNNSSPKKAHKRASIPDEESEEEEPESKSDMISKMLLSFKEDLLTKLNEEGNRNREVIFNLNNEMNTFKTDIKNVVNTLNNKQKIQMESVRWILEHAGSKRLKGLSQRILTEEVTDMNNLKQLDLDKISVNNKFSSNSLKYDDDLDDQ